MSTKIYVAYRVKIGKLNELVDIIRGQMFDAAAKTITPAFNKMKLDTNANNDIKAFNSFFETKLAVSECERVWDIECGLNVWLRGEYAYVIPIADRAIMRSIVWPDFAEDYCYWNNVDEPEGTNINDWDERGVVWGEINCGNGSSSHNARRLYHAVVEFYGNTWDVKSELAKRLNIKGYGD